MKPRGLELVGETSLCFLEISNNFTNPPKNLKSHFGPLNIQLLSMWTLP